MNKTIPDKETVDSHNIAALIDSSVWTEGNSISNQLRGIVYAALQEIEGEKPDLDPQDINISHPTLENYGDYTTNVAFIMAGKMKMKPSDVVKKLEIVINNYIQRHQTITSLSDSKIPSDISSKGKVVRIKPQTLLERVEVAGNGFLNLWLHNEYLITQLKEVLNRDNGVTTTSIDKPRDKQTISFTGNPPLKGRKIAVEYTDPNPFKEFHLGHLYSNVIGESISRLFEACGASVWRGDFYGDVGMHVAKSVYGLLAKLKTSRISGIPSVAGQNSLLRQGFGGQAKLKTLQGNDYINELKKEIKNLEKLTISQRQKLLGEGYAIGVRKYEEDKIAAEEMKDINYLIYVSSQEILKKTKGWRPIVDYKKYVEGREDKLEEISIVYEAGLKWSLEYFESIYKRLGTKFDGYYPESWVGEYGMKIVEKGLKMGILKKNDGAVVYEGEQDGLHTRVFVNKLGLPTYEAKDLGLAYAKYQDFPYDLSINVFGKEIDEYYKVVRAAMRKIEPELGKKANYIAHGMVKLPEGKMSSRTGNVITYEWLIDEAKKYSLAIMKDVDLTLREKQKVAEIVGLGAIRFALLKSSLGNDVVFDFEKSISFEGDSGPYLQYTYARCKSVLRKAESNAKMQEWKMQEFMHSNIQAFKHSDINPEELSLLRTIYKFPEVVAEAAKSLFPSYLCEYLFDLAQKFNLFYSKHSILGQKSKVKSQKSNKDTLDLEAGDASDGFTLNEFTMKGIPASAQNIGFEHLSGIRERQDPQIKIICFRLLLTSATARIIQQGLKILGIETVERM